LPAVCTTIKYSPTTTHTHLGCSLKMATIFLLEKKEKTVFGTRGVQYISFSSGRGKAIFPSPSWKL